ncbi:hypothetical protein [uncultured Shewanella sp.]|uniref:hypothetical protein n=1 Tax=Shewanella atlantica TaxID=271099 RepID=UPI0026168A47|nr:hypothetical protein [uncultured Shewanella sp.]
MLNKKNTGLLIKAGLLCALCTSVFANQDRYARDDGSNLSNGKAEKEQLVIEKYLLESKKNSSNRKNSEVIYIPMGGCEPFPACGETD